MVYSRLLMLSLLIGLLAPGVLFAPRPATAQEAGDGLTTAIYAGACGDDVADPAASLTQPILPEGEVVGASDARAVATSFSTVPLALEALLDEEHVVAVVEEEETAACGAIGGLPTDAGAIVIELSEEGDSGLSGVAYLAPSGAGAGQTDISLFLAGLEPAQPETPAEPTAEPTTEETAEATTASDEAPTEVTVEITSTDLDPGRVVIPVGGTVTWVTEEDRLFTVIVYDDEGQIANSTIQPDESFSHTFNEPGAYTASDVFSPGIVGTIIVEATTEATGEDTAEANQDANVEATEEPVEEVAAATETYVSPSFGYSLSYDPRAWEVVEGPTTDADGVDIIGLQEPTGFSTVYFSGIPVTPGTVDAQSCTQIMTEAQTSEADVVQFESLYLDEDGTPLTGGDASDAFATTIITRPLESGGTGEQAFYTRCIVLPSGTGVLAIQQFAAEIVYDSAAAAREELLEGLTLP